MEGGMIQYFGQTHMGEQVYAIYRKRYTDELTYQEQGAAVHAVLLSHSQFQYFYNP